MKRKIIGAVTLIAVTATISSGCVTAQNDNIKVNYDSQTVDFDVQPEIIDDRVMVPMRTIFETFGAKVKWDADTQTITAKRKSKTIEMTIGSTDMTKNDETYSFDAAPVIIDGRTLVPIRAIGDMLGLDVEWDASSKTVTITTPADDEDDAWKSNTGTIDLSGLEVTGDGVSVSGNVITVSEGGDFEVTGTLEDGQIVVDAEDKVKLRLSGMSLINTSGSAIYIKNADKAYITLTEGTDNYLADGESYTSGDDKEKGCISACDNLEIKGNGFMTVEGNCNYGIYGGDSVDINNGNITITAVNDGIHVNETLEINGGTLNVTAEGDGIQAEEIVSITEGTVNVTTTGEVAADTNADLGVGMGGGKDFPNDGSDTGLDKSENRDRSLDAAQSAGSEDDSGEDVTSKGIKADWMLDISGGDVTVKSTDHAIHCASDINIDGGVITLSSESKKGISGHGNITINDGEINILKSTEGIESKQILTVNGGDIDIIADDDGLNSGGGSTDNMIGGNGADRGGMNVGAPENTEFAGMENNGKMGGGRGNMDAGAPENTEFAGMGNNGKMGGGMPSDAQTAAPGGQGGGDMTPPEAPGGQGGGDMTPPETLEDGMGRQEGMNGGMGGGQRETDERDSEHHIQINGGNITITAGADGIDSNGSLFISGGTVKVSAQASGAESAFDAVGAILINGGTVICVSGSGLGEAPNSYSQQNVIIAYTTGNLSAGDTVKVTNSSGKTLIEYTVQTGGNKIVFSSADIKTGETYTVTAGDEELTGTVESVITSIGTASGGNMNGGMRGNRRQEDNNALDRNGINAESASE